ncbi:MAG: EamA family transporter [Longibaculum sp.]
MWLLNAFLSAFFAGITSILSKIGLENISSHYVTAMRTSVVLIFTWLMVLITGSDFHGMSIYNLIFIILSGLATGVSWLCYYRALSLADVSQVAPIDKLSTFLSMIFAFLIFHEKVTWLKIGCMIVMLIGTYLMQKRQPSTTTYQHQWLFMH